MKSNSEERLKQYWTSEEVSSYLVKDERLRKLVEKFGAKRWK